MKNQKSLKLVMIVIVVIILVSISMVYFTFMQNPKRSVVSNESTKTVLLEGVLESNEVDVSSKIPGRMSDVYVDEGDMVKAGQVIALLESKEVNAKVTQASGILNAAEVQKSQAMTGVNLQSRTTGDQIKQAEAGYKAARAKLTMALNGARPQEIAQAKAAVDQAEAAYNTAKITWDRFKGLYAEGVIPKQQEDEVELKYLSAKSMLDAASAKYDLVKEGARKEEIEAARQGVEAAGAQLKMAKDSALQISLRAQDVSAAGYKASAAKGQLDEAQAYQAETRIIAPIDGYVSVRSIDPGEMVSAGYPIMTIVKGSAFKVKVYADESKFGNLKLHNTVPVQIPALGNKKFTADIVRISQAADFAVKKATNEQGSYDVRSLEIVLKLKDPSNELRTGMTARVLFNEKKP